MDKVSSPNRQKKEKIVAEISEKVNRSKGMVFTNYQGLTHLQLEKLKKAVKPLNADFTATKNTLLKLSLSQTQNHETLLEFRDPTATLFLYGDPIAPLKELAKMIKELNLPLIKFGILDNQKLTDKDILRLSALPPKDVLLAQLMGLMKGPIFGFHRALSWNMQKFAMTLKAIETKKSIN